MKKTAHSAKNTAARAAKINVGTSMQVSCNMTAAMISCFEYEFVLRKTHAVMHIVPCTCCIACFAAKTDMRLLNRIQRFCVAGDLRANFLLADCRLFLGDSSISQVRG